MLFVDEFCGILVYIKFGADVTSQYNYEVGFVRDNSRTSYASNICKMGAINGI